MNNPISNHVALLAGAVFGALALSAPTPAQARTTVFDQRFDGSFATAIFDSDTSACVQTSFSISVIDGRAASATTGAAVLTMIVDEFDACTGTELGFGVSQLTLSAAQFEIDHKLASAALVVAAVPFFDFTSGRPMNLALNLAWTASDQPVESRLILHLTGAGGGMELLRVSGAFSDASVSGTPAYADGSTPSFTLRSAQLGTSHDGTHTVTK